METKYIFVTGGVVSGLGKGLTAASIGKILKSRGFSVTHQKLDPYINVDPGTMSPCQHGEVFVTEDGAETDLDLGHYERFVDENLNKYSSITTGKIYMNVINKERKGEYLGSTVQIIPHITNEIKDNIYKVGEVSNANIVITEIGGTVGDMESMAYLEAIRQVKNEKGQDNVIFVHVTLIPFLNKSEEIKTKPSQHSVRSLMESGILPDFLVCRTGLHLDDDIKNKLALFCNVSKNNIIENYDVDNIYELPLMFEKQNFGDIICERLKMQCNGSNLEEWKELVSKVKNLTKVVRIGLVGKYVELKDAYLSVAESLRHAGVANDVMVDINYIDSEKLEKENNINDIFKDIQGIIVPGGFGTRGIEGKIIAIKYARENNIPFFGICLGMQLAVIEHARNVLKIADATSLEFNNTSKNMVINLMENQKNVENKGGTMRLGTYPCVLKNNTKVSYVYGVNSITERHRHRFEYNNEYGKLLEDSGLEIVGTSPDNSLVEIVEMKNHRWFVGCQFHPEFKSRLNKPHPLFLGFIKESIN